MSTVTARTVRSAMVLAMQPVIEKAAIRRIKQLPRKQHEALLLRLTAIAADPFPHHATVGPSPACRIASAFVSATGGRSIGSTANQLSCGSWRSRLAGAFTRRRVDDRRPAGIRGDARAAARARGYRSAGNGRGLAASGETEAVPIEIAQRLIMGEPPLLVWCEYRCLDLDGLARTTGLSAATRQRRRIRRPCRSTMRHTWRARLRSISRTWPRRPRTEVTAVSEQCPLAVC